MNKAKILAVLEKELADARKNKMIIWSMLLLPVVMVGLTLGTAYFMLKMPDTMDEEDMSLIPPELGGLNPVHALVILFNDQYMFYLLIIPMAMPVYIAAYSIVGEKETKSLEPLLATPISIWELLIAKSAAAVVPPVILTWISFIVLAIGGYIMLPEPVFDALVRPVWLVGMALLSPLLALLSVFSGVIVSSRVNDPRVAQQVTGIFVVPIIALSIGVLAGRIFMGVPVVLLAAAVTLLLDGVVLFLAIRLFQRETILTRWK